MGIVRKYLCERNTPQTSSRIHLQSSQINNMAAQFMKFTFIVILLSAIVVASSALGGGGNLAPHVADIAKCRQILADIACRSDTEESPTHPIFLNYSRQVQVSPNVRVSYPTIEFLCLNSNNNQKIADTSGIPRHVVKCRVV